MTQQEGGFSPEVVLDHMRKNGVTHVVWLPDSETNFLYLLMKDEPNLDLISVSREGQAFSTAAGLSVGGAKPIILIQNTGLMESGDSLRGWAMGMNIPVVLMVGYRGYTRHGVDQGHRRHLHRTVLKRLQYSVFPGGERPGRRPHFHRL